MTARVIALACGLAWAAAGQPNATPSTLASAEQGKPLYELHCQPCHGEKGQGDGRAAVLLYPKPRDFTKGLFKIRTTPSGSLPADEDLFDTIGRGMPGSAMPAFSQFSSQERWALVSYIKTFVQAYQFRKPEPAVKVGQPPARTPRMLAVGKQIYRKMECFKCHGESGQGDGPSAAELKDDWDIPIRVRDFTDGTYKGGPADRDLYLRFTTGMAGTPMPAYSDDQMTAAERWALVSFVQSLRRRDVPKVTPPRQGLVAAVRAARALPADPVDPAWRQVAGAEIPMNLLWQRSEPIRKVTIRAMYDQREIAILLEWRDPRPDTGFSRTDEFRDAVAIQFALDSNQPLTFVGMGHAKSPANIWHWKSDWQAQVAGNAPENPGPDADFYPFGEGFLAGRDTGNAFSAAARKTPVENLVAAGFGSLTPLPDQLIQGKGLWSDGAWHVLFRRTLQTGLASNVAFAPGATVSFALACWDGSQGDRDGQKTVSTWYRLRLAAPQTTVARREGL